MNDHTEPHQPMTDAKLIPVTNGPRAEQTTCKGDAPLKNDFPDPTHLIQSVFDVTGVGICITNEHGCFIAVNNAYCNMYQYSREELIGQHFTIVVPKADREASRLLHDQFIAGIPELPTEWRVLRRDGAIMNVAVTAALMITAEGHRFKVTTVTDVTRQKQRDAMITRFGHILEQSYNEIYIGRVADLRIQQANSVALANLGYQSEELQQLTLFHLTPQMNASTWSQMIAPLIEGRESTLLVETLFERRNGSRYSVELRFQTMMHETPAVFVVIAQDRTEKKKLMRIQEEIRLASEIQRNLMPRQMPDIPGYDLAILTIPSYEVSGDYVDVIVRKDEKISLVVADVAGKGIPSALLMANLQAVIRGQTLQGAAVVDCLAFTNTLLYFNTPSNRFVTLIYAVLDNINHRLEYANAGHNLPLLFRCGKELQPFSDSDMALGVIETCPFHQYTIDIGEGDILVIFSDGITEAMNCNDVEFGEDRIIETIQEHTNATASELIELLRQRVADYTGSSTQRDDMTVMVLKRLAMDANQTV